MENNTTSGKKRKSLWRLIFGRTTLLFVFLIIQLLVLLGIFGWMREHEWFIYGGITLTTALVVIYILNNRSNPEYKLSWMIPVLVFPVFGTMFYLYVELTPATRWLARRLKELGEETAPYLQQDPKVLKHLKKVSTKNANLAHYVANSGGFPVYDKTYAEYFPLGEDMFARMKEELRQAKRYIFMEYFILERGEMWDEILEILKEKAAEGVEVRVMYDGMCSLFLLPHRYPQELEKSGIRCRMFSPIRPVLSTAQNNRDHRKITVIDGHTAFTGGINLADEYINREVRFGHWKDTAIMLKGDAVQSFLMMFLQNWNVETAEHKTAEHKTGEQEDYGRFLRSPEYVYPPDLDMDGFVMPYGDSPLDGETVGKYVYLDMINEAKRYVHIMTPYLILDSDMITALTFAAKRGIEVIIIMPHIPDKWYAYCLARSYYEELIAGGVQIYEYTPGFVHAKVFASDDEKAVVGSINLDYRSFYLHFECAVYLYRNAAIRSVEKDFQKTLEQSQAITLFDCRQYPLMKRVAGSMLRVFAPLM